MLQQKIKRSIELIKKFEGAALAYKPYGYHLAFSGGKDSQVLYELSKMAGVQFKPFFYKTSIDPPELLSFIKTHYPDVTWLKPEMTMFQLILKKKMLPLRNRRYCCEYLKERQGLNELIQIGIRKEESKKRGKRKPFESSCKFGKDQTILSPILEWKARDVWTFLNQRGVQTTDLYKAFNRIGCIGCPLHPKSARLELHLYPNFKKAYLNTIAKLMAMGKYSDFESPEDVLTWWTSGKSKKVHFANKKQLKIPFYIDIIPNKKLQYEDSNYILWRQTTAR